MVACQCFTIVHLYTIISLRFLATYFCGHTQRYGADSMDHFEPKSKVTGFPWEYLPGMGFRVTILYSFVSGMTG